METNQPAKLQPNTTQIPHIIIREWLPLLKDTELRVLLIVADQTLGWLEDAETGRRKEKDWISHWQMQTKTGKSERSITRAVAVLVDNLQIVQTVSADGKVLDSPAKRLKHGSQIFYRLNLRHPEQQLMPTLAKMARVKKHQQKQGKRRNPSQNYAPPKWQPTKETVSTKRIQAKAAQGAEGQLKNGTNTGAAADHKQTVVDKLPTIKLLGAFKRYAEDVRRETPEFERGKDGNLIKAALGHLNQDQLELLFLWFLTERRKMSTTIGAALCQETIDGFITATRNEYGFYARMTAMWQEKNQGKAKTIPAPDTYTTAAKLALLKQQLAAKLTAGR